MGSGLADVAGCPNLSHSCPSVILKLLLNGILGGLAVLGFGPPCVFLVFGVAVRVLKESPEPKTHLCDT